MIHLVVTCVGSKIKGHGPSIVDAVRKVGVEQSKVEDLYGEWKTLLKSEMRSKSGLNSAKDMYRGATWSAALAAYQEIKGPKTLWIISCGFGLIEESDQICKYAATFKNGESDSVYKKGRFSDIEEGESSTAWWRALIEDPPLGKSRICSLHQLVKSCDESDTVIIAAGADYLGAVSADLEMISDPEPTLYLIGYRRTGSELFPTLPLHLSDCVLPFSDGKKYRQYLKDKLGACSATQVHNKAVQYLIRHIQSRSPGLPEFP